MPKSGDKVRRKGKNHSVARGALKVIDDLNLNPWVENVGVGRMRGVRWKRETTLEVKWYNGSESTYKLDISTIDYVQTFYVRIDPRENLSADRFFSSYS